MTPRELPLPAWPSALPTDVVGQLDALLGDLPGHRVTTFRLRVARWWADLVEGLAPSDDPEGAAARAVLLAAEAFRERDEELHLLDERRSLEPDWFQRPSVVGYAADPDRLAPPGAGLLGLAGRVGHLRDLGVSYLHLRSGRSLHAAVGAELGELARRLREGGISLGVDLDLDPGPVHRSPAVAGDGSGPDVFTLTAKALLGLANQGVEIVRLEGLARLGASGSGGEASGGNTPRGQDDQGQQLTQALRTLARIAAPALVFQAVGVVGPNEVGRYLGEGQHQGKVADLVNHHSLMVQVWSMMATGDSQLATQALGRFQSPPPGTAWVTSLRDHEDVVWSIDDQDARSVMVEGWSHRAFLAEFYAGDFASSWAEGLVLPRDATSGEPRTAGTAASLAGLGTALRRTDEEALAAVDAAVARILLGYAVVFGWGGVPVIWSGDEVATLNETGASDDDGGGLDGAPDPSRAQRPRLDPARLASALADPASPEGRVRAGLRQLALARAALPHLHAAVVAEPVASPDRGVFAVLRRHPVGPMLQLYNVTGEPRTVPEWWVREHGLPLDQSIDALNGFPPNRAPDGSLWLSTYQPVWLVRR